MREAQKLHHRLLYHLIQLTPQQSSKQSENLEGLRKLKEDNFYNLSDDFTLEVTPEAWIYQQAIEYYNQTGSLIPRAELNSRIRTVDTTEEHKAELDAVVAAIAASGSNGSDIPFIIDKIVENATHIRLRAAIGNVATSGLINTDPALAREKLLTELQNITTATGNDYLVPYNSADNIKSRLNEYKDKKTSEKLTGLLTGFPTFDEHTGGLHETQTLLVVAQPKTGKSAFCTNIALNIMLEHEARNDPCDVLFVGKELRNVDQANRIDAMLMHRHPAMPKKNFNFADIGFSSLVRRLETGTLSKQEQDIYLDTLRNSKQFNNKIWMVDGSQYSTLNDIETMIATIKKSAPLRVVFVDAVHHQTLARYNSGVQQQYQMQSAIVRKLEDIAVRHNVLVVCEVQEKRECAEQRTVDAINLIAESSDFARAASHVLRLLKVPKVNYLVEARMVCSRFCAADWSFPIYTILSDMFLREAPLNEMDKVNSMWQAAAKDRKGKY